MHDWLIIGASGHARSVAAVIRGTGGTVAAVSDRDPGDPAVLGAPDARVFTDDAPALDHAREHGLAITVAIGENAVRERVAQVILATEPLRALAHPLVAATATVDALADLGPLVQVLEHAHVGPGAVVGAGTIVNTAAVIEHDARVGDWSHVAPGAVLLGAAAIGEKVFLGSGARVLPGRMIGPGAVLGAGTVAVADLEGMATYGGVPARPLHARKVPLLD
ncbi:hexapeptide transferase [Tersicoccus solisilvae]|uniref:Hexapeptide transferase n=1 Tax=Tersicoccus solisilvae TaxID=1882339 RepID=A0ABQ1NYC2_9MICC|nr:transferase [Tersicoccus solisilvae]GGC87292.1 hexapeptide transferase [Tersicoccus solisilvae]